MNVCIIFHSLVSISISMLFLFRASHLFIEVVFERKFTYTATERIKPIAPTLCLLPLHFDAFPEAWPCAISTPRAEQLWKTLLLMDLLNNLLKSMAVAGEGGVFA